MGNAAVSHGYGFRYDPMTFVEKGTSLQAALVRTFVLQQPKEGDAGVIRARIDGILAAQREDGALSDHPLHAVTQTGGKIREAIELGVTPDDPRVKRAVEYVVAAGGVDEKGEMLSLGMARALHLVGAADGSAVRDAVRRQIARAEDWIHPWSGCPWTPAGQLKELWEVRDVGEGVDDVITRGLQGIAPKLNEAGCLDFNDPWGYLDVAGTVDHPLGREIVEKQIPMILRSQEKDGGWGEHSLIVFRALVKYGLLTPLRQRPPLPPDWEVVRSIPAPEGDLFSLAWDGARLWVYDQKSNEAIAVSPDDGKVLRRLALPAAHVRAVGWWDGALAVTQQLPTERGWTSEEETRRLLRVNPETGQVERNIALQHMNNIWGVVQVDGRLVVADGFLNAVGIFDAAEPGEPHHRTLGAPGAIELAVQDGTVWHSDWLLTEIIFRSDLEGRLLDWGTKPFDGDLEGLAWDGKRLWALDSAARQIHAIRRATSAVSAQDADRVRREDGRAWIEGMERANWGGSFFTREDSQVRCLVEALRCAGREVSYADVMGLSGAAFKLTMAPNLFVAEIHSEMGMDWQEIMSRVWGMDYAWKAISCSDEGNPGWRQQLHEAAVESVDRGMPLFYMNGEWNLLVGYREDGSGFICKPYAGDDAGYQEMATPGGFMGDIWFASVLRPSGEPADKRESIVRSLRTAVELASRPAEEDGKRLFGSAAYEAWIAAVESGGGDASLHGNAFSYSQLLTSRQAGAEYLGRAAAELGGDAAPHLRTAADRYEAIAQRLNAGKDCVRWPWEENWTSENRAREATILRDCLADEKAAVAEIQAALRLLASNAPAPRAPGDTAGTTGPRMLEGLTYPKRTAAELACVEGALRYLGQEISAAWLYGGTGHAFAINMRPTVCVSSPYAWRKTLYQLAPNLGFRVEGLCVSKTAAGDAFPARQREAYDMVRDAIDRGIPCYADRVYWMPDYALITGYDDVGYYYAHWRDKGGPTPWQQLGTEDIEVLDVWRVELCEAKPDDQVVKAALESVLQRAATPDGWTMVAGQVSGPAAYDLWADELASGRALLDSHSYNAIFWREYREMAVGFLEEAKRRLPGRCDAAFDEAITHYRVVRDRLAAVCELTPCRENANWTETLRSPEAAELIRQAGAGERQGLVALAKIVRALGGAVPEPMARGASQQKAATPKRFVLEGVPKVAYHTDRWRFTPFCNALDAALQYLGEKEQYDYLMCTSGAMFRMTWHPKAWDQGNSDILGMTAETLEPMRRAFRSAGYQMRPVAKTEPGGWPEDILRDDARRLGGELTDEAGFRRRIVESVDAGRPVIAFGVIGPPEACLITGYDERGDVLLGWNVFQHEEKAETEPSGYFRVRNWYPKTHGLLLFGDKVGRPDPAELDRETLKWALQVLRTPRLRSSQAGPAAFDAWAADMLDDAFFPKDDVKILHHRLMCHWDSMTVTATRGSGSATAYLLAAAERNPAMAEHLRAAADCLEHEDVVHGVAPGEEAHLARLADPKVRREVADSIRHARDMHVKAADHIERALLAAGMPPGDIPRPEPGSP